MQNPASSRLELQRRGGVSTQRKVQAGFAVALGCLVLIGIVSWLALRQLHDDNMSRKHARDVISHLDALQGDAAEEQNGRHSYLLTGEQVFLDAHLTAMEDVGPRIEGLRQLLAEDAVQLRRLEMLEKLVEEQLAFGRDVVKARQEGGVESAQRLVQARAGRWLHREIREQIATMRELEEERLEEKRRHAAQSASIARVVIVGGGMLAFAIVGVASVTIRRDFIGRRRAEEALRESEESLEVTFQSIGDAVLATDTEGKITRMNRVAEQLTGWSLAEATGRDVGEIFVIINESSRQPVQSPVGKVLATGQVQGLANHTLLVARDGTERAIADSAAPIHDRDGEVIGVVLVFRDVSVERAAEIRLAKVYEELAAERARLKFMLDAVPIGISLVHFDPDGRAVRFINEAYLNISGLTRDEADVPQMFTQITHPEDRQRQAQLHRRLETREIDRYVIDKRYVQPSGQEVWVMFTIHRRHFPDGSYEDLSCAVDISARKQAVAELERFFELSIDFLCISSVDGYFKRVSPAVTEVLGWTVEEFLARPYLDLVHPDDRETTQREVERQMATGEKTMSFENRFRHKDGSWRVLSWRSVPQPDGLMYATARDVTEYRQFDERIQQLNRELHHRATLLEAANKELEAFSYSVSHDLRAPLRHIQGYVTMLSRELGPGLSEKAQHYLTTISDAARRMGELIDHLLSFSRMGRTEMHETIVDPHRLIEEAQRELDVVIRDRDIRWKIAPLPLVQGDRVMLKQVFANLLGNAVKYTRGRAPAEIEIGCAGRDDERVVIFVRDNGAGFDMKYAGKLFGVFQRLHRIDEFEGSGIGLANVRRIITRHGGSTWAEGKVNEGATFFITLKPAAANTTGANGGASRGESRG